MKVIAAWRVVHEKVIRPDEDILYSAARFWAWLATLGGPALRPREARLVFRVGRGVDPERTPVLVVAGGRPVAAAWWPQTPDYHAAYRYDLLGSVVGVRVRRRP